jgi:hypothetical protein
MENPFDELKNQWGWAGFTTRDFERCQIMARLIALVYNWWSLFVRLVDRQRHCEAVTSRPMLLGGVARQTKHAGQNQRHLNLSRAQADKIKENHQREPVFRRNSSRRRAVESYGSWRRILAKIFEKYLYGRPLEGPVRTLASG